ncbi:hypothetical protein HGRIS_011323 [Hohenbuehelia grisea]|uniref:Uncharacterized protein n=1 Tax=Hohenbuehelia grisea TaxID=104357 RepID=A0ABR3JWN8_9AGAR
MRQSLTIAFLLSAIATAQTVNDWSQPCFNHTCTYHLPREEGQGTLKLWGPPGTISDITPSAGWEILDCDPHKKEQEIRIVCKDGASCEHLNSHDGPEGKIVRLPESCGKMAFARIRRSWVHDDQTIPHHVARHLSKRGPPPVVLGKHITHELASRATSEVKFEAIGTTSRSEAGAYTASNGEKGEGTVVSGKPATPAMKYTTGPMIASSFMGKKVVSVATAFKGAASKKVGALCQELFSRGIKNVELEQHIKPNISDVVLGSVSAKCDGGTNVTSKLTASVKGDFVALVGVHMRGTIDGKMERAEVYVQLDGKVSGGVKLSSNMKGKIPMIEKSLFKQGLPGLSFGHVFAVGPTLEVVGMIQADLELKADLKYDFNYDLGSMRQSFPPKEGPSDFKPKDNSSPLGITVDRTVNAMGQLSFHIVPRVNIELSFTNSLRAAIYVAADTFVGVGLNLNHQTTTKYGTPTKASDTPSESTESVPQTIAPKVVSRAFGFFSKKKDSVKPTQNPVRKASTGPGPQAAATSAKSELDLSLIKAVPDTNNEFQKLSSTEAKSACLFVHPQVKLLTGMDFDAGLFGIADLLGFNEKLNKISVLKTFPGRKWSLLLSGTECPKVKPVPPELTVNSRVYRRRSLGSTLSSFAQCLKSPKLSTISKNDLWVYPLLKGGVSTERTLTKETKDGKFSSTSKHNIAGPLAPKP